MVSTLFVLYFGLLFVVSIPSVKVWLAKKVGDAIGQTVGSRVEMNNLSLNLFSSFTAEDFVIFDQNDEQMIFVDRIDVSVDLLPLLKGKCNVSSIKLFKGSLTLYKDSAQSDLNAQFLIDSLQPKKDKKAALEISPRVVVLNDFSIKYDVKNCREIDKVFDRNHMKINDLCCSLVFRDTKRENFYGRVRNLQFEIPKYLKVNGLKSIVATNDRGNSFTVSVKDFDVDFKGVHTQLYNTEVNVSFNKKGQPFAEGLNSVALHGSVHFDETEPFFVSVNLLNKHDKRLRPYSGDVEMTHKSRCLFKASFSFSDVMMNGLFADYVIDIEKEDLLPLKNIIGEDIESSYYYGLTQSLRQKGMVDYKTDCFVSKGETDCDLGKFAHEIKISDKRRVEYDFDIESLDFPLSNSERALGINNAKVAGTLSFGDIEISEALNYDYKSLLRRVNLLVAAEIGELSSPYAKLSNVKTDLLCENNKANLKLNISDPQANLLAEGDVYLNHVLSIINGQSKDSETKGLSLTSDDDFSRIKIRIPEIHSSLFGADWHGVSVMSAENIDLQYKDLHDFNLAIENFSCYNNDKAVIDSDNFYLRSNSDGAKNNYNLKSNDFEGNLVTNIALLEIPNVFLDKVFGCIPALDNHNSKGNSTFVRNDEGNSDVNMKLKIGSGSFVSKLLSDNLCFDGSIYVDAHCGGSQKRDVVTVMAPKLTVGTSNYDNASIYFYAEKDSLGGMLMTTKYFGDTPVRLESRFCCVDNQLSNNLTWKNLDAPTGGRFSTQTKFERLNAGGLVTDTKILPTSFVVNDTVWQISPSEVYYGNKIFKINNFRVSRQKQFVNLNADLTNEKRDILLELNDVEVAYLLDLVGFKPVEFSGRADGTIRNIPETKNIGADIKVKNFCFNTGPMGTLRADVLYNADDGKININAKTQASPEDSTLITGYVNVADNTLDLHLKSEKTNLQFLNKFVRRFISDLEGNTSGDLRLFGDLRDVNIEGDHCVNYMKFRPTILGVMYSFENDSLHLRPDTIDLSGMTLRDPFGNYAKIKGSINHHFLYDFDYNFDFSLKDLQIINWEEEPSRSFWGNVFTSGNIGIGGTFSKVNIGGELTPSGPRGSSVLNYNSETTSLGEENKEYVSFVTRDQNLGKLQSEKQDEIQKKDNSTDIYMNFKFNINPSATLNIITDPITHDNMSLSGGGPIRMSYYNKGKFELNGQYTINEGNYKLTIKDIIRRNFVIRPGGYLRFNGSPSDGELNITGVHKINSVSLSDLNVGATQSNSTIGADCILYFTGKASEPKVSFGLDFPNANPDESRIVKNLILTEEDKNMQAVYLLSIGRFYTYNYNDFNTTGRSQSSVAMTSFLAGTLSGQINSLLQDAFHVDNWSFDTNIAAGRMGFDDMEVQGSLSGRMFNNRLLFNGNIGYRDQMTTYSNNFVGNFNIQWFLNKTGSVSLKAYSETNDRYFTKSSLTTQGGGILFKKDFNKFKNFFIRQRKKK